MIDNTTIGERIKACRQVQKLTLKTIEARAGVSATHISEIERGKTSPTIGALTRIADALGKEVTFFLEREALSAVSHQRASERPDGTVVGGATYVPLSKGVPGARLMPFQLFLEPGRTVGPRGTMEANHIFLVRQGQVRFIVDGDEYTLEAGDSIHIGPEATYESVNEGGAPVEMVLFSSRRLHLG